MYNYYDQIRYCVWLSQIIRDNQIRNCFFEKIVDNKKMAESKYVCLVKNHTINIT